MEKVKISFVLGKYPNPRMKKRIQLVKKIGEVSLICWNMGSINFDYVDDEVEFIQVDINANRTNPLKRLLPMLRFIHKAMKKLFSLSPQILYVENIDMLLIGVLYYAFKRQKPKIIYEIADLHTLIISEPKSLRNKIIKKVLIFLEKKMCKYVDLLIITSEKFYEVYYINLINKDKVIYMPNMPDLTAFTNFKKKQHDIFTIGFVGSIRYYDQMKLLIEAIEGMNINIIFAGFSYNEQFQLEYSKRSNVKFLGKFDYDKDVAHIYEKLDCVYSVYNADDNNVKVALPNKLYEAIYCEIPIIVAKGTYLSEIVSSLGVGLSVSHTSKSELEEAIYKLSNDKEFYDKLVYNCKISKPYINIDKYNLNLFNRIMEL